MAYPKALFNIFLASVSVVRRTRRLKKGGTPTGDSNKTVSLCTERKRFVPKNGKNAATIEPSSFFAILSD